MSILKVNGKSDYLKLAKELLLPVAGGAIVGVLATRNAKDIYKSLDKPSFAPPSWLFPAAWTTLYTAMGLAKYRVGMKKYRNEETGSASSLYNTQLGLNFLWSFLFFKWGLRGTAFIEMAVLLSLITMTTYEFYKKDKPAGTLMVPYIAWVSYALALNYSTWQKNKA